MDYVYREYLHSTDWYASRQRETGEEIPLQVLMRRDFARKSIIEPEKRATQFDKFFDKVDKEYEKLQKKEELIDGI